MPLKILVCVKRVVEPSVKVNVRLDGTGMQVEDLRTTLNPFDEVAAEEAIRWREAGHASQIIAVSVGPQSCREILRTVLAMGADRALLLVVPHEPEPLSAAKCLAALVQREKPDLVLMGKQSTDHDHGQTPGMLAGLLGWPQALQVSRLTLVDGVLHATCELDNGSETVSVPLPAVVSTDLRLNTPRYATLPAVMKAKKKPLEMLEPALLGLHQPTQQRLKVVRAEAPSSRRAGHMVPDVRSLVAALRDDARVL